MPDPIDVFAAGARDGVYPGGQLAASIGGRRLVNAAVGALGEGLGPTHPQALYDLASLTKPLATTLLLMRAVELGRCRLEDPLATYVPGVDPEVTLTHALEHATGFPAHLRFDRRLPPGTAPGTWPAWRHIVLDAAKTEREAPVDHRAVYSDVGFILLGAALEVIYARPLPLALAELGGPLFYRDFRGPPSVPPVQPPWPIAPTEAGIVGLVHDENARAMGGVAGHAGLWGTAEDVLRVCEGLVAAYHGDRSGPLSPDSVRRMWQPSLVPASTRTLGWDRPSPGEGASSTGGRWPPHAVGHLGFTGTSVWIEPDRGLVVVLVTNRVCPTRANNTIRRLRPALYDAAWGAWSKGAPPRRRRAAAPKSSVFAPPRAPAPRTSAGLHEGPTRPIPMRPPAKGGKKR